MTRPTHGFELPSGMLGLALSCMIVRGSVMQRLLCIIDFGWLGMVDDGCLVLLALVARKP